MNYKGVIIEESLEDKAVLGQVKIVDTKVEPITPRHKTPWLTQWTLHTVEVPEADAQKMQILLVSLLKPVTRVGTRISKMISIII